MISCILAFYIAAFAPLIGPPPQPDADALYAARENLSSARQAEAIWAARLAHDANDFEAAWKLARARYWIGGRAPAAERKTALEAGIAAGRAALRAQPRRPEGYFWAAANMGALAESFGLRQGIRYRGEIKELLLKVLELDPGFQQGSADRALGRWYFKVPGLFGGSDRKAEEHLRRSLTYGPNSTISHYFLGETLLERGRRDEARRAFARVLEVPVDPEWAPEDREFKGKAKARLAALQ